MFAVRRPPNRYAVGPCQNTPVRRYKNFLNCLADVSRNTDRESEAAAVQMAKFFNLADTERDRKDSAKRYLEFLRVPAMSAGVYVLPAGGTDPQSPHHEDEMYYVVRGRGRMRAGSEEHAVGEGSIIFVASGVEHCFYEITEELTVLVFFAPAETG